MCGLPFFREAHERHLHRVNIFNSALTSSSKIFLDIRAATAQGFGMTRLMMRDAPHLARKPCPAMMLR